MNAEQATVINNFVKAVDLEDNIVGSEPKWWYAIVVYSKVERKWMFVQGAVVNNMDVAEMVLRENVWWGTYNMDCYLIGTYNEFLEAYGIHGAATEEVRINQECAGTYPQSIAG